MDADVLKAPELTIPDDLKSSAHFLTSCPPDVQQLYARIWTDLTK
jgi:spermidine/putrescine transport system substrate-binding protein